MKMLRASLFIIAWCCTSVAGAADLERGRQLHEDHCMECHTPEVYVRENRIVNSFQGLKERIRQCELSNELAWFEEEVDDVAAYLNAEFYRFDNKQD